MTSTEQKTISVRCGIFVVQQVPHFEDKEQKVFKEWHSTTIDVHRRVERNLTGVLCGEGNTLMVSLQETLRAVCDVVAASIENPNAGKKRNVVFRLGQGVNVWRGAANDRRLKTANYSCIFSEDIETKNGDFVVPAYQKTNSQHPIMSGLLFDFFVLVALPLLPSYSESSMHSSLGPALREVRRIQRLMDSGAVRGADWLLSSSKEDVAIQQARSQGHYRGAVSAITAAARALLSSTVQSEADDAAAPSSSSAAKPAPRAPPITDAQAATPAPRASAAIPSTATSTATAPAAPPTAATAPSLSLPLPQPTLAPLHIPTENATQETATTRAIALDATTGERCEVVLESLPAASLAGLRLVLQEDIEEDGLGSLAKKGDVFRVERKSGSAPALLGRFETQRGDREGEEESPLLKLSFGVFELIVESPKVFIQSKRARIA